MRIEELLANIKNGIKDSIKEDMPVETINKLNSMIKDCDEVSNEYSKVSSELKECKESIIKLVKTQGDANPPEDPTPKEKQPRSLEEIAKEKISKK